MSLLINVLLLLPLSLLMPEFVDATVTLAVCADVAVAVTIADVGAVATAVVDDV